jgi:hypothetical protein
VLDVNASDAPDRLHRLDELRERNALGDLDVYRDDDFLLVVVEVSLVLRRNGRSTERAPSSTGSVEAASAPRTTATRLRCTFLSSKRRRTVRATMPSPVTTALSMSFPLPSTTRSR